MRFAAYALCLLAGCSGRPQDPPRVPVHPVDGKLIVGGRLAGNSRVVFHPIEKGEGVPYIPVANAPGGRGWNLPRLKGTGAPKDDELRRRERERDQGP